MTARDIPNDSLAFVKTLPLDKPLEPRAALVIGELIALTDDGTTAIVSAVDTPSPWIARAAIRLDGRHIGARAVLAFEHADGGGPIVIGMLQEMCPPQRALPPFSVAVEGDGERLVVSAKEQLVLRCGEASITLTRAGKVLIEGTYVSTRSSSVNRIKGGTVQIN